MDHLSAMRVFARVVETASFTKAADSLSMGQATVTKAVQHLEARLQTKLLNRNTRRVLPTADGLAYYERGVRVLAELDDMESEISSSRRTPSGRLRVEMAGAMCDLVVIPALNEFQALYPDIQLDVGVSDRSIDYLAENVDCALRAGAPASEFLIARQIATLQFVTVASQDYLRLRGTPAAPEDLHEHSVLGYLRAQSGQVLPLKLSAAARDFEMAPNSKLSFSDIRSYLAATEHGLGVGQMPEFLAAPGLREGRLQRILADWTHPTLPLYVVYLPNRHLSRKVRVFVDWLVRICGTGSGTSEDRQAKPPVAV
ncbi:LysR family transcriptional regulator [Rhizobium deserti]|uniref:HTH-type transcriptional regulator TtuA n=1 Tax=Rhizobium deserti TaxID=2547961 RepID=A0A4R5UPA1_9HYPH|nr:LysR family transcriptional regulator [Rhizobium deserti]TDK39783.1 LysR family transcriptional regulator [Rhizobium deserti]